MTLDLTPPRWSTEILVLESAGKQEDAFFFYNVKRAVFDDRSEAWPIDFIMGELEGRAQHVFLVIYKRAFAPVKKKIYGLGTAVKKIGKVELLIDTHGKVEQVWADLGDLVADFHELR